MEARNRARVSGRNGREVRSFTDRRKEGDSYLGKGIGQASCEMLMSLYGQWDSHLLLAQVWMRFVAVGGFSSQGEGGSEVVCRCLLCVDARMPTMCRCRLGPEELICQLRCRLCVDILF
jgi:hypothetical protein